MEKETFAKRLQELIDIKGIKAVDIVRATGIDKSRISHYLHGDWEAKQDSVLYISEAFNVNPAWLMGYDVPMEKNRTLHIPHYNAPLRFRVHGFVKNIKK